MTLINRGLKLAHLRLAAELSRAAQLTEAATRLGIAQPAASRLAAEAEALIGAPLYTREGRGIALTPEGRALAARAARVLAEIEDAGREIEDLRAGLRGLVRIGSVTGPAIEHVLPVLRQARIAMPGVTIEVEVGTSDHLGPMLLDRQLDFSLARLPSGADPALFTARPVGVEPVSLIVRANHPLMRQAPVAPRALLDHDWVLPPRNAILRRTVAAALAAHGLPMPARTLNTASFLLTLAAIGQTNAIAPVAASVAQAFMPRGGAAAGIVALPTPLAIEVETYSLLTLAGRTLPPAAAALLEMLTEHAGLPQAEAAPSAQR